jgi:hypothetical protein
MFIWTLNDVIFVGVLALFIAVWALVLAIAALQSLKRRITRTLRNFWNRKHG